MTNLNYSPLTDPITDQDVALFKQFRKSTMNSRSFPVSLVALAFPFLVMAYVLPTNFWINLIVLSVVAAVIGYLSVNSTNKFLARLYKFATINNLELIMGVKNPGYQGMIFESGHDRILSTGYLFPDQTLMGNYRYTTGSGKNRRTYSWGFVKVKLTRRLPHMVLDAKANDTFSRFSNLPNVPSRDQILKLEGDFNNYYTLYAPKEYEQDALYVFTPDVMAAMIDAGSDYDMEIIDDNLLIYHPDSIQLNSAETIDKLLTVIGMIQGELLDQTKRYSDARVGDYTQNLIDTPGQRLKKSNYGTIIAIISLTGYLLYVIVNIIINLN